MDKLPENPTLEQAKAWLRKRVDKGDICPCCLQKAKVYQRSITSSMAWGLLIAYQKPANSEFHAENMFKEADCPSSVRGDFAKLRYWNLIQPVENKQGYYRVTDMGRKFALREVKVQEKAKVYNDRVLGFDGKNVGIIDALKNKFNYAELMSE